MRAPNRLRPAAGNICSPLRAGWLRSNGDVRALIHLLTLLAGLLLVAAPARAQSDEPTLLAQVSEALWPADIVRAADRYLQAFPQGSAADAVQADRRRAGETARLLARNDVRLYRSAFAAPPGATRSELRLAALGDRAAVLRLARASRDGEVGPNRWVGWLQLASLLGDENASYELALHFRRTDQPVLAAHYETRAVALGYQPARSLDNVRK